MRFVIPLFCALAISLDASAQVGVFVETTAEDTVGKRLDFVLRDELRASNSFQLTYDEDDSLVKISLITLDPDEDTGRARSRTIYSFNILLRNPSGFDYFYTSFVGHCGAQVLDSCAKQLAQEIGVVLEDVRQAIQRSSEKKSAATF